MKAFNLSFVFVSLLFASTGYSMDQEPLKKGVHVRIVDGPERLCDQIMEIQGTSKEVWGIEDVWGSQKAMGIGALQGYMFKDHGPDDFGIVYYVKNQYRIGFCVHESWIVLVEAEMEESTDNDHAREDNLPIFPEQDKQGLDCVIV